MFIFLSTSFDNQASANGSLGSVSDIKNYNRLYQEIEIYFSPQADRVVVQLDKRDFGGQLESPMMFGGEPNSFMKFRFYCAAEVSFSWYRIGSSNHETVQNVRITPQFINNCMCETATNTNYPTFFKNGFQWLPQTSSDWHSPSGFASCGYDGSQDKDTGGSGGTGGDGSGGTGGDGSGGDGSGGSGGDGSGGDGSGGNGGDGSGGDGSGGNGGGSGSTGKVTMGWNHVKNPSKGSPQSYKVYRDGQLIDTIPGTQNSYTDSKAKPGEKHEYKVVPVYPDGSEGDEIDLGEVEVKEGEETFIPGGPVTGSGKCDPCKIFECPGWQQYLGKLDQIKDAIPPAPNWKEVADTFRDSIVPNLVGEVGDLLGKAPEPPSPPPQLPGLDDRGLKGNEPKMQDVPGLKDAGFDANKIKNQAPVIPERADPTGGFDLLQNPMDTLPDAPENPKPGQTDPGAWGQNKPKEEANPFPFPQDTGEPNIGTPPKPSDNGATPPTPGTDSGSAPKPGDDLGTAPTPGGTGEEPGIKDYKPRPDAPDGSGGEL